MLLTIVPAATMANSPPPPEVRTAEWKVLSYMNQVRANHGLNPLRMAGGVRLVARDRSRSMRRLNYFGHVSPTGWGAGHTLRNRHITHAFWGEAIGWTKHMGLNEGAKWMVDWWKKSTPHRRLILRSDFNYAGVGIARDGAKTLWTVVFVNQPDHTPPLAGMVGPASGVQVASSNSVTVKWWGKDRRLSTRTAGLKNFTVQRKIAGGEWRRVLHKTTKRSVTLNLRSGDHYFRLRARDNRGNMGGWRAPLKVVVS